MKWLPASALLLSFGGWNAHSATCPPLSNTHRVALAEAFRIERLLGDSVWPGFSQVPFIVLLVSGESEYLINHPSPPAEFAALDHSTALGTVMCRPRQFAPDLLATFPAVGGKSTVVVGTPEATRTSPTAWVITLLHEHFHQLQNSQPSYYAAVDSLGLSGGDRTGMWMLNYPFPYDSAPVIAAFDRVAAATRAALDGGRSSLAGYETARAALRSALSTADERYLELQLWQEGIARYTEYQVALLASSRYAPAPEFTRLTGYRPFREVADSLKSGIMSGVLRPNLREHHRVSFYSLGAAIGLLLDTDEPMWRSRYFARPFVM